MRILEETPAIDNQDPPASVAVCNSPSSQTAGEQDPSTREKLLEPVSEARGGEVPLYGTLQPASQQLPKQILANSHSSRFAGHFSGRRLYDSLLQHWWWRGMFQDATAFARSYPECAVATGFGRRIKPPLQPISVSRPFQILGIDVMDLPLTDRGNSHVVVVQDLFTKWPFAFPVPDF